MKGIFFPGLLSLINVKNVHNTQVLQALGVPLPSETKPADENKTQSVATPAVTGSDETTPTGSDDGNEVSV